MQINLLTYFSYQKFSKTNWYDFVQPFNILFYKCLDVLLKLNKHKIFD